MRPKGSRLYTEIHTDPNEPGTVGFLVSTEDGTPPTPQQILDAISDALLMEYEHLYEGGSLDS